MSTPQETLESAQRLLQSDEAGLYLDKLFVEVKDPVKGAKQAAALLRAYLRDKGLAVADDQVHLEVQKGGFRVSLGRLPVFDEDSSLFVETEVCHCNVKQA